MQRLAEQVMLAWGWPRRVIALAAGAVCALAMPPLNLFPALFVGLPVAVWLIDGAEPGGSRLSLRALLAAAAAGRWFGFGYFLAGLWWLGAAFIVDSDEFLWALPLGVLGLPAGLALFHALGFLVARLFWSSSPRRLFALALGLGGAEILRGHILTGFPWNSLGQAFGASLPSLQIASVVGLHGLTILAVLLAATPATLGSGRSIAGRFLAPLLAIAVLAGVVGYGMVRLATQVPDAAEAYVPGVALRIVQPNVSQREKNRPGAAEPILKEYLALSDRAVSPERPGLKAVTHLFWPESPFSYVLGDTPEALRLIGDALPDNVHLITGAVRRDPSSAADAPAYFNALQAVDGLGVITQSYDKVRLVPFGEYLPLEGLLRRIGVRQFITTPGGFQAGTRQTLMDVPGLPSFLPLICYEAIFSGQGYGKSQRPQLAVNATNDAWFGRTFGPYQHFEQARMRAVELGIPLIRTANTGISAVIDPFGRVIDELPLGEAGIIDAPLPKAGPVTPYVTYGWALPGALLILCLAGCISRASRARQL
jgi:apolipoprotein N-acyltransferase